jgi:hypothetical protein
MKKWVFLSDAAEVGLQLHPFGIVGVSKQSQSKFCTNLSREFGYKKVQICQVRSILDI